MLRRSYERRLKRYLKDREREMRFVLNNLDTFLEALNAGTHSQNIKLGFIHSEPGGVLAIDQQGAGKNAVPLRLYLYPENETKTLHLITLGDKKSQHQDVQTSKKYAKALKTEGPDPK